MQQRKQWETKCSGPGASRPRLQPAHDAAARADPGRLGPVRDGPADGSLVSVLPSLSSKCMKSYKKENILNMPGFYLKALRKPKVLAPEERAERSGERGEREQQALPPLLLHYCITDAKIRLEGFKVRLSHITEIMKQNPPSLSSQLRKERSRSPRSEANSP